MLISASEHTLKLNAWQTKRELAYALDGCDSGSILLGDDVDEARQFFSAVVYMKWPKITEGCFGIGVCSEGHGLLPHLLLTSNTSLFFFGFNNDVVGIKPEEKTESFRIVLDALFNSFIHLKEEKIVLALHEIGIVAMAEDGDELWRYSKDVIVDFRVEQNTVSLNFMDSPSVSLDLSSGRVICHPETTQR